MLFRLFSFCSVALPWSTCKWVFLTVKLQHDVLWHFPMSHSSCEDPAPGYLWSLIVVVSFPSSHTFMWPRKIIIVITMLNISSQGQHPLVVFTRAALVCNSGSNEKKKIIQIRRVLLQPPSGLFKILWCQSPYFTRRKTDRSLIEEEDLWWLKQLWR